jgi:hypothetical protein
MSNATSLRAESQSTSPTTDPAAAPAQELAPVDPCAILSANVPWFGALPQAAKEAILADCTESGETAAVYAECCADFASVAEYVESTEVAVPGVENVAPAVPTAADKAAASEAPAPDKRGQKKAALLLQRIDSTYRKALAGYRDQLLATGKLCHEYVALRLSLGHTRAAAVQSVEGKLSECGGESVNANRLIATYHVSVLLGTGIDLTRFPYRLMRECTELLERVASPSTKSEAWTIREGLETDAKALFARIAAAVPVPDFAAVGRDVKEVLATAALKASLKANEAAKAAGATEEQKAAAELAEETAKKARETAKKAADKAAETADKKTATKKTAGRKKAGQEHTAAPAPLPIGNPLSHILAAVKIAAPKDSAAMILDILRACKDIPGSLREVCASLAWSEPLAKAVIDGLADNRTDPDGAETALLTMVVYGSEYVGEGAETAAEPSRNGTVATAAA